MNKKLKTLISCIVVTVFFTSNLSSISAVYAESAKTKVDANQLIKEAQQKLIEEEINNSKYNQKIENNSQQEYDEKDKKVTVTVETYDGIINNSKSVEKKLKREIGGTVKHEFKNVTKVDANQLIKEAQQKLIEEEINNSKYNQKIENNSQQEYDEKDKKVTVTVETYDGIINNSKSVEKKLKREIGGTVKHEFKNVIKGFSVEVDKNDVEKIKKISGVRKVTKARRYKPLMNNAIDLGQAAK